jgi:sterol desaturase/sphingolipid hydroxylase (fatty acid hydroxylase superfamily)
MERYGEILLVAMPAFLLLVLVEKCYGVLIKKDTLPLMDMISSLSSGITNATKDVLGLSFAIISYKWMVGNWALVSIPSGLITYFIAFMALDFSGYWVHRIAHRYNVFWNNHIIHHSSEEYNLACALRQSISVFFKIFTFFLLPAAFLGVPPNVIAIVTPLHLFAQFWYHTRHIGKMGFLEKIIVTPSHHRVHHAINKEYIDKNFSNIFIFWDKWFGTFQEELPQVTPVYGITRPAKTWNPIRINFSHLFLLIKDAVRTKSIKDKFTIWFQPTGWRPLDVIEKYPVEKIETLETYHKYNPTGSLFVKYWSFFQLFITLLLVSHLFGNIASINQQNPYYIYVYGVFVLLQVYSFTDLMDGNSSAPWIELLKTLLVCGWIYFTGDWFLAKTIYTSVPLILPIIVIYSCLSTLISFLISFR